MSKTWWLPLSALTLLLTACDIEPSATQKALTAGINYVDGNPTCASLGLASLTSKKIDPPTPGTYDLDAYNQVTFSTYNTPEGPVFDWNATIGIDVVIVKGSDAANVYLYDPEASSGTGLHAPINPSGYWAGLSHIDFCFDYEVLVSKTAETSFKRTWSWDIDKSSTVSSLTLATGETISVPYSVLVTATGSVDSDWAVAGAVTVKNPAPFAATLTGVTDSLSGAPISLDCGVTFPYELAPGDELVCTYATGLGDASDRVNTAEAATTGPVGPGSASVDVSFASAAITTVDGCVEVTDQHAGALGQVCAADSPKTFTYSTWVGPYAECGTYVFDNTASFVAPSGASGWDSYAIAVEVPCTGCTLTPGYWKTHSERGPAPYDDTWALLPAGAATPFFLSAQSYYEVLWTAPRGNAYYILAHAYVAAKLNGLNGASLGAVQAAFDQATTFFEGATPATKLSKTERDQVVGLAAVLDAYNNGLTGPGHCSE